MCALPARQYPRRGYKRATFYWSPSLELSRGSSGLDAQAFGVGGVGWIGGDMPSDGVRGHQEDEMRGESGEGLHQGPLFAGEGPEGRQGVSYF